MVCCSKCSSENLDDSNYCIKCGANLTSKKESVHADWRDYVALKDEEYVVEDCNFPRSKQDVPQEIFYYPVYGFVLTNQRLIVLRINYTGRATVYRMEPSLPSYG